MDLVDLIQAESIAKIKDVIELRGLPIDSRWLDYESLNVALQAKRTDVAMYLLERNCRVNKTSKNGDSISKADTPLHHAVILGDIDIVHYLLNEEASVDAANSKGNTPLHLAFILKREAIVDTLLAYIDKTSYFVNSRNNQGLTHFHIACTRSNEKIIEKFLKDGADVKETVSKKSFLWGGFNALHFAANSKSLVAVRTLVTKSDVDLGSKNKKGQTPFCLAYQQFEDILIMLDFLSQDFSDSVSDREYSQFSYFHMACLRNNPEAVRNFITKGVDVNTSISYNTYPYTYQTPLFFAIDSACNDNVEILLENGADVNRLNDEGMTPLHLTFYAQYLHRKEEILDQMYTEFDKKMMIHADGNGLNLLHIACTRNDIDTVTKILDSGKNVNKVVSYKKREFYRFTPLHFAVKYGHIKMAELLIEYGANVNANDDWGHGTPLHLAFAIGHKELIDLLLISGADPMALQISENKTMLHCLISENNDEKEELFEYVEHLVTKLNIDVNAKDKTGSTPLHYACRNFQTGAEWIKLLLEFGADVNLESRYKDLPFAVSFRQFNSDNVCKYMAMYHHVQKLKALGLSVHNENQAFCEKLIKKIQELDLDAECFKHEILVMMEQQRQEEIDKMKQIKLTKSVSLRDFLLLDIEKEPAFAKNKTLKKVVLEDLMEYPSYAYLIRLQYRKVVNLNDMIKKNTRSEALKYA